MSVVRKTVQGPPRLELQSLAGEVGGVVGQTSHLSPDMSHRF